MLHLEFCCRSIHAIHPLDKTLTGIPNKSQNHYDRFKRLSSLMNTQSSPIFIHLKPPCLHPRLLTAIETYERN